VTPGGETDQAAATGSLSAKDAGRRLSHGLAGLVILAALVIAMLLAVPGLKGVGHALKHANRTWIFVAIAFEALSNIGYELVVMLALPRAPRRLAGRLAWAESAFGAAISIGGVGSLALGAWVLHSVGVPGKRIAERSAALFLATSGVNVIVLAVTGIGVGLGIFSGPSNPLLTFAPASVAAVVLLIFLTLPILVARNDRALRSNRRWALAVRTTAAGVRGAEGLLFTTEWLTIGAWAYLLCDIAVLWLCLHALGSSPPFAAVILAYQIGYLANILPVPGGIGVVDAGLVATLVLYGVSSTHAAAAELAYHAIALWVPALLGTLAFVLLRRQIASGKLTPRLPRNANTQAITSSDVD
jgi:uncharacterized membrane protein YbhN (UPF0104 family)